MPKYDPQEFAYHNQNKDMLTVIYGNPFSGDKTALDVATTSAMQGRNVAGGTINFTASPSNNSPSTKFVIQFNAEQNNTPGSLCGTRAPFPEVENTGEQVTMMMAYCYNSQAIAYVQGSIKSASGADDPDFKSMIGAGVQKLTPNKIRRHLPTF